MSIEGLVLPQTHVRFYLSYQKRILLLDDILALGCFDPSHRKAELLNTQRDSWQVIAQYPLGKVKAKHFISSLQNTELD